MLCSPPPLTTAGYRTGLFTSPHLHTIRERIAINGYPCSEQDFVDAAITVRPGVEAVNAGGSFGEITTFEALTAMAFVTFATNNVEMQVIEVGLGGRLDSTNVVEPAVTGITSISLDHEAFLGSTIREIASEKAGIIKSGIPVVSAPQESDAAEVIVARSAGTEWRPLDAASPRHVFWRRDFAALSGQDFTMWGECRRPSNRAQLANQPVGRTPVGKCVVGDGDVGAATRSPLPRSI